MEQDENGVVVSAGGHAFRAAVAVVTAGAWSRPLLARAGIELDVVPTRETVAYFSLHEPSPPTLVEWGAPAVYALPSPGHGIKAGEHVAGPAADPELDGEVDQGAVERLSFWVRDRFPSANPFPIDAETCLYTNTHDQHFVLERHGNIVVGSPCSGHGFKFAPLIGRRLAALAAG